MPISFLSRDQEKSVFVWQISEDEAVLNELASLTPKENEVFGTFRSDSRKRQWLAVRALLNKVYGDKKVILYNEDGRPNLSDGGFLSISHSDRYASVLIANKPRLGVDIEALSRNYVRVAPRFITQSERDIFSRQGVAEEYYLPIAWSCKEAAFKAAAHKNVDFTRDISIQEITLDEGKNSGMLQVVFNPLSLKGNYKFTVVNDHILVWGVYEGL